MLFCNEKITASMPIFCKKNVHSRINISHDHILSKKRRSSQKHGASFHLHQIFHEKTHAVMPILCQKSLNSVKTTLYYKLKKSIGYPFYRFFTKSSMLSCPYFVNQRPVSKKHCALMPIFCQKTSIL